VNNRSGDKPPADMTDTVRNMKAGGDQFAVATVVRTVSVTAAKPGAKAIINDTGDIVEGWIGGGCARSAVVKAAIKSIKDGEPRLVTIQPEELLKEQGLESGEEYEINGNICRAGSVRSGASDTGCESGGVHACRACEVICVYCCNQ